MVGIGKQCKYCPMNAWVGTSTCYVCWEKMLHLNKDQEYALVKVETIKKKKKRELVYN